MSMEHADWRDDAACLHADPGLFFPSSASGRAVSQVGKAKGICRACPVRISCLTWALNLASSLGIWGGTTEDERRAIRRVAIPRPRPAR